jgi:5-methylcytosine-specific restriction endonuclease McrA
MSRRSGRTHSAEFKRNRTAVLARDQGRCHICGHGPDPTPALTVDHIVPRDEWIRLHATDYGWDGLANLAASHGSVGNTGATNRCRRCVEITGNPKAGLCNQRKSDKANYALPPAPVARRAEPAAAVRYEHGIRANPWSRCWFPGSCEGWEHQR